MRIKIDFTKSAQDNAQDYFNRAKKLKLKKEGAERAIKELEKRLKRAKENAPIVKTKQIVKQTEKEWYEKFRWFFTSDGHLVIGGRDAHQNELLNSKHFDDKDLFFHADIFGAQVTILKDGLKCDKEVKEEVAQFAASHSSAWKEGQRTVDVYAMRREQVSKSKEKGGLGTGSFLLTGEREWYRSVPLELVAFTKERKLGIVPMHTYQKIKDTAEKHVNIMQGKERKSDAAKKIAKMLEFDDIDYIMQLLPPENFKIQ